MIEDVYEPLARYRDEFKEKFARLTREKFQQLLASSGVDVGENRKTVAAVKKLEKQADALRSRKAFKSFLVFLCVCAAVAGGVYAWMVHPDPKMNQGIGGAIIAVVLMFCALSSRRGTASKLREVEGRIRALREQAWTQMEPLNRLYTWDIPVKLIEATVPRLAFDPFFTAARLDELRGHFGLDDAFNEGRSVVFAQSGVINGNPFAFGDLLEMDWGERTYEGSLEISWTEWEEDAEGRAHLVRRSETLHASVTKPVPVYQNRKILVYGNDAAPDLTFTRMPSELSDDGDGFFARWRKNREVKKLQKFSRNLDDDSQYTLMANHEFEALFQTMDRNNEVQYRLLFTALAQTQMLALLKDREVGYGDDFSFIKAGRINQIEPAHLATAPIDTDPARFRSWDADAAEKFFCAFNEKYFKDLYFTLAPLLVIPLYQQTRTHEDLWRGVIGSPSSFWEHESVANYYGESRFRHPDCVTRSILKTHVAERQNGVSRVDVTAYGFRTVTRIHYESVHGGDGYWHDVPVEWDEYLPVQQTKSICLAEGGQPLDEEFRQRQEQSPSAVFRRSIHSRLA